METRIAMLMTTLMYYSVRLKISSTRISISDFTVYRCQRKYNNLAKTCDVPFRGVIYCTWGVAIDRLPTRTLGRCGVIRGARGSPARSARAATSKVPPLSTYRAAF